jgi:hypothetical protein
VKDESLNHHNGPEIGHPGSARQQWRIIDNGQLIKELKKDY